MVDAPPGDAAGVVPIGGQLLELMLNPGLLIRGNEVTLVLRPRGHLVVLPEGDNIYSANVAEGFKSYENTRLDENLRPILCPPPAHVPYKDRPNTRALKRKYARRRPSR
jgi:hypothetical protein